MSPVLPGVHRSLQVHLDSVSWPGRYPGWRARWRRRPSFVRSLHADIAFAADLLAVSGHAGPPVPVVDPGPRLVDSLMCAEGFVSPMCLDHQFLAHGLRSEDAEGARWDLGRSPFSLRFDHEYAVPDGDWVCAERGPGLDGIVGGALCTLAPDFLENVEAFVVVALEEPDAGTAVVWCQEIDCSVRYQRYVDIHVGGDLLPPRYVDAVVAGKEVGDDVVWPVHPPPHGEEVLCECVHVCERLLVAPSEELVRQGLVIAVAEERPVFEVMAKLVHGPRGRLELGESSRVVLLGCLECSAEVCYWPAYPSGLVLEEGRAEALAVVVLAPECGVHVEVECASRSAFDVAEGRSGDEFFLNFLKGLQRVGRKLPPGPRGVLLQQVSQRLGFRRVMVQVTGHVVEKSHYTAQLLL